MSTKAVVHLILVFFVITVLGVIIYYQRSAFQQKNSTAKVVVEKDSENTNSKEEESMSVDRIQSIENEIAELKTTQQNQESSIKKLSTTLSPTPKTTNNSHQILNTAQAQGATFSTSSSSYTPTGVFTNISCTQKCILWINFYTSSKNSIADNVNTYSIFIDSQEKGIYTQSTLPISNSAQSVSLNTTQQMNSGTHTVEIQARTSGGTLQQDVSYLQVMAIAQ